MKSALPHHPSILTRNVFSIDIDTYLDTLDPHYHPSPADINEARMQGVSNPNSITKLEILDLNKSIIAFLLPRLILFRSEYLKQDKKDYSQPRTFNTFDEWISDIEELIYCLQMYYEISVNHSAYRYFIDNKDRFKTGLKLLVKLFDDLWI